MSDLISRQAAIEMIDNCKIFGTTALVDKYEVLGRLRNIPTADVVPVKHGKWILVEEPMGWTDVDCAMCSVCKEDFVLGDWDMESIKINMKYCPNCGARMDGDDDA